MDTDLNYIASRLIKWYELEKRELPWRETKNPYYIWISEIILQQTRVVQGYDYYIRFINKFPTIEDLAKAEEDEVLNIWQGLGYYSRARNIHHAAKTVVLKFEGQFPSSYEDIISLKGIGEYTAAAIISFAFNKPYATVDGNVFRFLSRLFGISIPIDTGKGKKEFTLLANKLMPQAQPASFNQAIMEFGALQCVPASPSCSSCCFNDKCIALYENKVKDYPVKQGRITIKNRYLNYVDIRCGDFLFLRKRVSNDIWKGLYELPLIETDTEFDFSQLSTDNRFNLFFSKFTIKDVVFANLKIKHVLSHQIIYASFTQIRIEKDFDLEENFIKIKEIDLDNYPISKLIHSYFTKL